MAQVQRWQDERDDERLTEQWRRRMLNRYHRDRTLQAIERAGFNWRRALLIVLAMAVTAIAFGYASMSMQRCSGQLDHSPLPTTGTGASQRSASAPHALQ